MSYCKKCGFQRGEGSGCDGGCEYEKPALMTKTREEAEKLVCAISNKVLTRLMREPRYTYSNAENDLNTETLNALYPKPDSERLGSLRKLKDFVERQHWDGDRQSLMLKLVTAAIKEEEAKQ